MGMTNEEFMKGIRARLQAAAREAAETELKMEQEAEAKANWKVTVVHTSPNEAERGKVLAAKVVNVMD